MAEVWALSVALATTLGVTGPVAIALRRRQIVDHPNARSSHSVSTPRGGGIAVVLGLLAGAVAAVAPPLLWGLLGVGLAAAAVGLADDLLELSALLRLALQLLLALAVGLLLLRDVDANVAVGAVLVVFWITAYVNAFNFMDGVNGISGVSGAVAGGWFLLLGRMADDHVLSVGGALLAGACLGFLPWNAPRATVFLGDVGSYGLGLLIGALAVQAVVQGVPPWTAAAPLLLYAADTAWTLLRRVLRGDSWREAHREHVYQRLCDVGLSHLQVSAVVLVVTAGACAAYRWLPGLVATVFTAVLLALYLALPHLPGARVLRGRQPAER